MTFAPDANRASNVESSFRPPELVRLPAPSQVAKYECASDRGSSAEGVNAAGETEDRASADGPNAARVSAEGRSAESASLQRLSASAFPRRAF
jgi:hypothetical protein